MWILRIETLSDGAEWTACCPRLAPAAKRGREERVGIMREQKSGGRKQGSKKDNNLCEEAQSGDGGVRRFEAS